MVRDRQIGIVSEGERERAKCGERERERERRREGERERERERKKEKDGCIIQGQREGRKVICMIVFLCRILLTL